MKCRIRFPGECADVVSSSQKKSQAGEIRTLQTLRRPSSSAYRSLQEVRRGSVRRSGTKFRLKPTLQDPNGPRDSATGSARTRSFLDRQLRGKNSVHGSRAIDLDGISGFNGSGGSRRSLGEERRRCRFRLSRRREHADASGSDEVSRPNSDDLASA